MSFETPLTPWGGLAEVMAWLPRAMSRFERVMLVTPHFPAIAERRGTLARLEPIAETKVAFAGGTVDTKVLSVREAEITTLLVAADGFFRAARHPYQEVEPGSLLRDALFFSAAVPRVLELADLTGPTILNLQDWQTAAIIGVSRERPPDIPVRCLLTLHNPYDQPLEQNELGWILDDPPAGPSVLASMLAVHQGPVSTVSRSFAHELLSDPLFTEVYADHLQHQLRRRGIIGIDNGMFGTYRFPFSSEIRLAAESGDFEPLIMAKNLRRKGLATMLERYERWLEAETRDNPARADELASWGAPLDLEDDSRPLFFMMGRDDPRQKGYDLAAAAISRLPRGAARFVFTPMAGAEGLAGLEFLRRLAEERPGEVKVFVHRLPTDVFRSLQRGSSFMLMPSLYEPFGGASEAYLAGIPVVARATGGLAQQVVENHSRCTGVLFREPDSANLAADWRRIVACEYARSQPPGDRVASRLKIPLFDAMVDALTRALERAITISRQPESYGAMILNGFRHLSAFTWQRAVDSYRRIYDEMG